MSDNNDSSRRDRKSNSTRDAANAGSPPSSPPPSPSESHRDRGEAARTGAGNEAFTRRQWEELPSDPDIRADLGYEITPWETIETATDSNQVIYMPQNEELLKDDTFIVADEGVLRDLGKEY